MKIKLLFLIIVFIVIINYMIYSFGRDTKTAFVIRESDFPQEWRNGEVKVAEITTEELSQYPILKNLTNGDCTKYEENWWRCNIPHDEWNRTKNFINTKENADLCIKIGEKCYTIDFVTCCTKKVEITDIFFWSCACPPGDTEMYREDEQNNEIGLNLDITIRNNQSIGTDMLTSNIYIKNIKNKNSSNSSNANVIILNSSGPFYIKSNSSITTLMTVSFPGPGEYQVEVQVFEKGNMIAQRSINKTIEAHIGNKSSILNEEYEIYSVIIPQKHENESKKIDKFVIRQLTYNSTYDGIGLGLLDNYINNLESYTGKKLDIDLIKNFKIKNINKSILENKFSISQKVILISEEEFDNIFRDENGWDRFYEIYPNSSGVIEISRVGFNNNDTQALVYYGEQSHYLAGNGYLILLIKEEGRWLIKEQVLLWVS